MQVFGVFPSLKVLDNICVFAPILAYRFPLTTGSLVRPTDAVTPADNSVRDWMVKLFFWKFFTRRNPPLLEY